MRKKDRAACAGEECRPDLPCLLMQRMHRALAGIAWFNIGVQIVYMIAPFVIRRESEMIFTFIFLTGPVLALAWALTYMTFINIQSHRLESRKCLSCGYSHAHTEEKVARCPECGWRTDDPAQSVTWKWEYGCLIAASILAYIVALFFNVAINAAHNI